MEERLIYLFSNLLQNPHDRIESINNELASLYLNVNTLPSLFQLFQLNTSKEIRIMSACAIKTTLKNVFNLLTDSDIMILKQSFISLYQSEQNFDALKIIIEASSIIFPQWPEIFDFIQILIDSKSDTSLQMAMIILSKIPEITYRQSLEKYIEMCNFLITNSLDKQTNCRAALELFSSISHFAPISERLAHSFPDFYLKFLNLYKEYLIINNSDSFQIAIQLEQSIKSIEINNVSDLLTLLIDLSKDERINNRNKVSIFNVLNSILEKGIVPDLFENILQLGIECSSSLFDNYCYIENGASSISFEFLKCFLEIDDFEDIFIRNLQTSSPNLVFASLSAISYVLPYLISDKVNILVSYVLSSCEIKNHSILEMAFSILYNLDFDLLNEEVMPKIIFTTFNNCAQSSNHFELQSIILLLITKLLFNKLIPCEMEDTVFSMLLALFNNEQCLFVRDKIVLCFAGLIECFNKESVRLKLPTFAPLLLECSKSFNPQCVLCQAAAIESISVCIYHYSEYFTELMNSFYSLLLAWIEDTQDRQHIESALYSFQRLLLSQNLDDINILKRIFEIIAKYLNADDLHCLYTGIDDSGITFSDAQLNCLTFIRKFVKYLFKNESMSKEKAFFVGFLPTLTPSLCRHLVSNIDNQEYGMKTILLVCKFLFNIEPEVVSSFSNFFMSIFDTNINLSQTFYTNLFNLDINITYPDDFFINIYLKLLQTLQEGNTQVISLLDIMSSKFTIFPIDQFVQIVKNKSNSLSADDFSGIVSIFCNYLIQNIINQDNTLIINEIMTISFNSLQYCTNFSIKPSPIRLLSLLINFSFEFNDQIMSQFYPYIREIFNNTSNPDLKTKYFNETILESILFILKVVVVLPKIIFPYELFFPKLFTFLPPTEYFQNNSEILQYLAKLPCIPNFSKMSIYFDDLFACLIRIISLNENSICEIGIENNSFLAVLKFAFQMLRAQESRIQIIIETTGGDKEKITNVQNRLNEIARNSTFLQLC